MCISSDASSLIMRLLKGISELLPGNLPAETPEAPEGCSRQGTEKHIEQALELMDRDPDALDGIYRKRELENYIRDAENYLKIARELERIRTLMLKHYRFSGMHACQISKTIVEHVRLKEKNKTAEDTVKMREKLRKKMQGAPPRQGHLKVV